jgi:hypothetical protein
LALRRRREATDCGRVPDRTRREEGAYQWRFVTCGPMLPETSWRFARHLLTASLVLVRFLFLLRSQGGRRRQEFFHPLPRATNVESTSSRLITSRPRPQGAIHRYWHDSHSPRWATLTDVRLLARCRGDQSDRQPTYRTGWCLRFDSQHELTRRAGRDDAGSADERRQIEIGAGSGLMFRDAHPRGNRPVRERTHCRTRQSGPRSCQEARPTGRPRPRSRLWGSLSTSGGRSLGRVQVDGSPTTRTR